MADSFYGEQVGQTRFGTEPVYKGKGNFGGLVTSYGRAIRDFEGVELFDKGASPKRGPATLRAKINDAIQGNNPVRLTSDSVMNEFIHKAAGYKVTGDYADPEQQVETDLTGESVYPVYFGDGKNDAVWVYHEPTDAIYGTLSTTVHQPVK